MSVASTAFAPTRERVAIDLRLAAPAGVAWLCLTIVVGAPEALLAVTLSLWSATVLTIVVIWRSPQLHLRRPRITVIVLALCSGAVLTTSAAVHAPARSPAAMQEAAAASRFVVATAVTTQTVFADTSSFTVTITGLDVGSRHADVSVPARAFGETVGDDIAGGVVGIGTTLRLSGTLSATEPGDDIAFLLFTSGTPEIVSAPPGYLDWANELRDGFRRISASLPGDGGSLLPGLAIGDTSAVQPDLDDAMKASSLSHLTAVSGANCAIVIALVMLATARMRMPRAWRIGSSLVVLGGFVVLVTPEPSVLRASVMAVLVLVTASLGRGAHGLPMLALAVLVLLTIDPWLARDYGFVLSVLATAGLMLLSGPLTSALSRVLPTPIAAALAIPLSAQITCQPVLILLAPSIPVFGVVANVLAGPAAPAATVVGLVACVVGPFAPWLGEVIAWVAWLPASWIAAAARFFADLPGARLGWLPEWPGVALVALVTAVALIALLGHGRLRRISAGILAVAMVSSIGVTVGTTVRTALTRPADWTYGMCDVGQGDASIIRSAGHIAVIDTGPEPDLLTGCLDALGIARVDLLVLTHFDLDHVGGAPALVGKADHVLVGPVDRPEAERLVEDFERAGARIDEVAAGASGEFGDFRWRVLWPPQNRGGLDPGNDSSIVLSVDGGDGCGGCLSALFLGDLGEEAQNRVFGSARLQHADVVKVAHHGSNDQSSRLYERVQATVALIGVGRENDYGHPTPELLDILASTDSEALRTDADGLILVAPVDDYSVLVWSERGG